MRMVEPLLAWFSETTTMLFWFLGLMAILVSTWLPKRGEALWLAKTVRPLDLAWVGTVAVGTATVIRQRPSRDSSWIGFRCDIGLLFTNYRFHQREHGVHGDVY